MPMGSMPEEISAQELEQLREEASSGRSAEDVKKKDEVEVMEKVEVAERLLLSPPQDVEQVYPV